MAAPPIRYATTPDGASLAYWTLGDGPPDVVFLPGAASHVEAFWDLPFMVVYFERLASFSRLISPDVRGCGLSDPVPEAGFDVSGHAGDLVSVLDAAGVDRAVVFACGQLTPVAVELASLAPERVEALVLFGGFARFVRGVDYDLGPTSDELDELVELLRGVWGTGATIDRFVPSMADDDELRELWSRFERLAVSPREVVAFAQTMRRADVRHRLGDLAVPVLVAHASGDRMVPIEHGRYLAEHIDAARFLEIDSGDAAPIGDAFELLMREVETFVTGGRRRRRGRKFLTSLLFVDVVGSTEAAARLGDAAWRGTLDGFRTAVRHEIVHHGGTEVGTRGDDFLVTFDQPTDALACARAVRLAARSLRLEVRAGVHAGVVERQVDDVAGMAVHVAARIAALAGPGEILASGTVDDLVLGAGLTFEDRGVHDLKGVPRPWRVVSLVG